MNSIKCQPILLDVVYHDLSGRYRRSNRILYKVSFHIVDCRLESFLKFFCIDRTFSKLIYLFSMLYIFVLLLIVIWDEQTEKLKPEFLSSKSL
jgi:hypothetical protein